MPKAANTLRAVRRLLIAVTSAQASDTHERFPSAKIALLRRKSLIR